MTVCIPYNNNKWLKRDQFATTGLIWIILCELDGDILFFVIMLFCFSLISFNDLRGTCDTVKTLESLVDEDNSSDFSSAR